MAAVLRAVAAARATVSAVGLRRMSSILGDLNLKREPELPPKAEPSTKLYVAGLNKETTTERLREAFSKFGQVLDAHIVKDRYSGLSRGFGFIQYATLEEAEAGKKGLDCKFLDEWVLLVDYAKPKEPPRMASNDQQSPPSVQGTSSGNSVWMNPRSPPSCNAPDSYQSQPSYDAPPSYQPQHSHYSPQPDEHDAYNNMAPVSPQTPPSVQYSSPNRVMAEDLQPQSLYQSQPSHQHPPLHQSQPPFHSTAWNEHYNTQSPPSYQDASPKNAIGGIPSSYQAQPLYQSSPSVNSYNHAASLKDQSPLSYQNDYSQAPSPSSSPSVNSYNHAASLKDQSPPSYQNDYSQAPSPSSHGSHGSQVHMNLSHSPSPNQYTGYNMRPMNPQSPFPNQYNSHKSIGPTNPESPSSNQYNGHIKLDPYAQDPQSPSFYPQSRNTAVPEDPRSAPYQHGSYGNHMEENVEVEASYRFGG